MVRVILVATVGLAATLWLAAPAPVCVFLGDSITLGARDAPAVTPQQRFSYLVAAKKGCKEVNSGISSDTTDGMVSRFDRDVAAHSPGLLYIMTENDYWPDGQVALERSEANLRSIIEKGKASGARVVLLTPPPIVDRGQPKVARQRELEPDYLAMQKRVAADYGVRIIDVNSAMGERAGELLGDPWHPNAEGQKFIADLID